MKIPLPDALHLLHQASHATLATITNPTAPMPGYPYATTVPNVLDAAHRPLLLVSALAEHTKNLLADRRVSLAVVDPDAADVQSGARLTLIGDAEPVAADAALLARYQRYVPEADKYLGLDFRFFRIEPKRLRYIGGVGQMGWIEAAEWRELPALSAAEESRWLAVARAVGGEVVLGVDRFGVDCLRDGRRRRVGFGGEEVSEVALVRAIREAGRQ